MRLNLRRVPTQELMRLDQVADHLNLKCQPGDEEFVDQAKKAVMRRIRAVAKDAKPANGEELIAAIASRFRVRFESVRSESDVEKLHTRYFKRRRELGFAMLGDDLGDPQVDALLFQLENAVDDDDAEFVAVLNLRQTDLREYWNKGHELAHRIAEPPQKILPFRRHPAERRSPIESLVDEIASEVAFYGPLFKPCVKRFAKSHDLTLQTVRQIKRVFAPSASLLSVANATVKYWPQPAIVLVAEERGRIKGGRATKIDEALRVRMHACNQKAAELNVATFPNMRVPASSPLNFAYFERRELQEYENLKYWVTSQGRRLPDIETLTSARGYGDRAYAIVSVQSVE